MTEGPLQLVGFANPVGFVPAFLQPVFASVPKSNTHYVQRIDDAGQIADFQEADLTGDLIAAPHGRAASVNDAALHAFSPGPGDHVLFGSRAELAPLLAARRDDYRHLPVLYLAIVEFCGLDEMKAANKRAYRHLVQQAGASVARSWRDSQIVLPIIRNALATQAKPSADDTRARRISIYSTAPSRLRVQAQGYDPDSVSNILRSRKMREALAATGLADKVTIALVAPSDPEPTIVEAKVESRPTSAEQRRTAERSSIEMALEELAERGLSTGLRRWLEDFIYRDFRKKSDDFPHYVLEWCDRQPVSRAAIVYARLLTLKSVPITLFREISHWLVSRTSDEDVGSVYPAAISLLRAREARYLIPPHRVASGAIISPKHASGRTPKALITDELLESEVPLWALQWIEENRSSRWTPQILQALIELPFDLPPVFEFTRDWLKRDGRRPEAGRLLTALLRSKNYKIDLKSVVRDVARWIDEHAGHDDAPRLLTAMLTRTKAIEGTEPFDISAHWLQRHKPRSDVLAVLSVLLRIAPGDKMLTHVALKIADWHADVRAAAGALALLLNSPVLPEDARWRAERWLEENARDPVALAVFEAYFRHDVFRRHKLVYARRALALIHDHPTRAGVGPLFAQLLARFPDDDTILDDALDWLAEFDDPGRRGRPVVLALLRRKGRKRRSRIHTIADRWLKSHPPDITIAKAIKAF